MHPALRHVSHRPWPLPAEPWIMVQVWHDLLFAHWPVAPEALRALVPAQLPLDTHGGLAWIGVVPFHMSGVRPRWLPPLPALSRFPEMNVRTYVVLDDKPGVYFFSLDAANLPAVWAARAFYHLPYFHARMSASVSGDQVQYSSLRYHGDAQFRAQYGPTRPVELRKPGTLDHWLTERYCLYTVFAGRVYRAEIHHCPWPLQDAEARIETNTMAAASGISLPQTSPFLHFAHKLEVLIWPLHRVRH